MGIIKDLQDRIKGHGLRIVFAEGYSQRVLSGIYIQFSRKKKISDYSSLF